MLIPKKVKHRKHHRGSSKGKAMSGNFVAFGSFGLKSLENSWVTSRQIEAARRAMTRYIQRGGKIWIRIFPDKPITAHGNESPMGAGKGAVDHFVAVVQKGRILFEMDGVTPVQAEEAMRLASHKLPVKTRFVTKEQK
ncbi:MAG: 50S ribosomal protein L16 [Candidatus Doudnabacteria bacterium RIFCSPLOWO2_02_FULL_42_9]|uniref:Large ribosomal subunit protein uL16 n=1 Tax=Candidatus Doudnabacteria bacterium RIFCSPHIGHO2_01_FULL_41_86 TaxID=1817821 RepID=A0A1F5N9C1_9BACT|nr:ribosomal protein L16 [uncultured bacterium]OGE74239.1 MAG: 50S ribosomal protein L16 [Candidatus Doudnabacteria bacterium RIFCSPHIGHO2_01_FULL_41_86]OGE75015.1 MAG: 50S ribosomal protein L16 [Candidatus Doudnabacteria bacterium RIFCSPHIGHO2_01_43_10]OGE85278.1 MAG: 50S ribosomal protein L16 [Candidatus Doudnabacteria bacterium RIFCSPHIGHO2_12_FULL_42_22]OGE86816.1 MAG: 50S ribosomal protein L16 [Candidatus Doudnabacteria bacterium RIFCSPHIGHO2_02_FULL_42_25]OGE92415.1 MAG: 50S ribosomal pr